MKNLFSKEAKIGVVTIISLCLLYFGINYLKGLNIFKSTNNYFAQFDNVMDVTISSPVYVDGFKVGLVTALSYEYETNGEIKVEMSLDKGMKINKDSYVEITRSFLGGASLHIHLNPHNDTFYNPGSTIEGRMAQDMMSTVEKDLLPQVEQMLPKIDSILIGLNAIIYHPALTQSLTNMEQTSAELAKSTQQLNKMLAKDVPVIMGNLKTTTDNFAVISTEIKDLDLNKTVTSINETLANLQMLTGKLNSTDNSLGLLLNDKSLYDNLNQTSENASKLLLDLRQNPKRYVHFSVF